MKKTIALISLLLLLISANGQIPRYPFYTPMSASGGSGSSEPPSFLSSDGYTEAWYIADEVDDITMTNNYVSLWEDHLGGGQNLAQGDGASQPLWSSSGITFDGTDDELLDSDFPLNQPIFIYCVMNQLTFSATSRPILLRVLPYGFIGQSNISGRLSITMNGEDNYMEPTTPIGEVGIYRIYLNGTSSKFIYNNGTPVTGSVGTNAMTQLALGHGGLPSNVRFLEIIIRQVAESSTDETAIYNYLATKYSIESFWWILLFSPCGFKRNRRKLAA